MSITTTIIDAATPYIAEAIAAGVAFILAWLVRKVSGALDVLEAKTGMEIEAKHREALHRALLTGVQSALQGGFDEDKAIEAAVEYAAKSVPDAIEWLQPAASVLYDIAASKLKNG